MSKLPHIHRNYPRVTNFTPFHPTASHFRLMDHFVTSALNDPKMTLNTKRSKLPDIHITITPSPKFHSALQGGVKYTRGNYNYLASANYNYSSLDSITITLYQLQLHPLWDGE